MDLITMLMNIIAIPTSFFSLLMFIPPFYFYKFLHWTLSSIFPENVAGKVVLITGASSGIGEELAYQYAKRGACLAIVARREDRLREVAERARGCGSPDVLVIKADVSKMDDCKRFVEETVNHFGQLDHLVNNAGVNAISALEDVSSVDNFRAIMDVNFWGAIYPTYYAIPHLRKTRGKIVVMSSSGGWLSVPSLGFYNASKAAIMNFYENLRTELGSDIGITVVTPGFIESEMTQGKYLSEKGQMVHDPVLRDAIIGPIPIMRKGRCSKGIVNGVCRGDRSITQPAWFKMLQYWQVFCPEVVVWVTRTMAGKGTSQRATLNKMILDVTGAKYLLYPSSVHSPETMDSKED